MKILIFAHQLDIGGTQVNAIELAAALRDWHGYDVVLLATPGPMLTLIREKGLRFLPAPQARVYPSRIRICALREAVRHERPDLIHVWDWWQCLDAYYGVYLPMQVPLLVSDMMMELTRVLPTELPTTFGTPEIVDKARAKGRRRASLMLPPVDVRVNAPGATDPRLFPQVYGIKPGEITVVTASRLAESMKSESLFRTLDAVQTLARELPLRYFIVGDGGARAQLEHLAQEINAELGRPVVILTGPLLDPRPAYAAADIVIGMGGSALRGMAFGKPVVVVGERGFSAPFTPDTSESFYYKGMYGLGDGNPSNSQLVEDIRLLAQHPDYRSALGEFSRQFVCRHFSLETLAASLAGMCRHAAAERTPFRVTAADGVRTTAVYLRERKFRYRCSPAADIASCVGNEECTANSAG